MTQQSRQAIDEASYKRALEAVEARLSPRFHTLDRYDRFVEGTQYERRPCGWWDDAVPLWERRPCIVYPITQAAIASNVDLVLGEGRFPTLTTRPGEDDADWDDAGLSEDDSEIADRFMVEVIREAHLRPHLREMLAHGQGCGSAVGIYGARNGRLFAETTRAKWCQPDFGPDGVGDVERLVIEYPYLDSYYVEAERKWHYRAMLYRREIGAETDVVMAPFDLSKHGDSAPKWTPESVISHGLGFCPVVWYPFLRGTGTCNEIDGRPIHANALEEIEAHDIAISQRHRAALMAGDPQICEFGVMPGSNPGEEGRLPRMARSGVAGDVVDPGTGNVRSLGGIAPDGWVEGPSPAPARKKGPGYVWQFASKDSRAEILTLPEGALKALDEHARDIRVKIAESLCVVFLDPENVKFAATVSGKALETLRARQIDRCDMIRDDFGDKAIKPSISMLMRIASRLGPQLRTPGIKKAMPVLAKFATPDLTPGATDVAGA